ncbi:hypothetical protein RJT34_18156 [Clitoria ternatea]|uniref:Uncharacterized protein n=1 Tax=Clitoria ternatea TaxID=43366 RepID=A0AAN9PDS2_CLITE
MENNTNVINTVPYLFLSACVCSFSCSFNPQLINMFVSQYLQVPSPEARIGVDGRAPRAAADANELWKELQWDLEQSLCEELGISRRRYTDALIRQVKAQRMKRDLKNYKPPQEKALSLKAFALCARRSVSNVGAEPIGALLALGIIILLPLISAPLYYFPELMRKSSGFKVYSGFVEVPLILFTTLGAIGLAIICAALTFTIVYLTWRYVHQGSPTENELNKVGSEDYYKDVFNAMN